MPVFFRSVDIEVAAAHFSTDRKFNDATIPCRVRHSL